MNSKKDLKKEENEVKSEAKENKKQKDQKDQKEDKLDSYYWGFLGFFVPIVGAIMIYFWTGKKQKAVKGISIGLFFVLAIILILGIVYIQKG